MNICNNDHEEICYEGRICPLCDMRDDLLSEIEDLKKEISDLEKGE